MGKETAIEKFRNGYNCSQSVFSAYSEKFGISKNDAYRIASGFGAGMGNLQNTCGAVTGVFMLIGCKFCNPDDSTSKQIVYQYVRDFAEKFTKKFDSINCLKLLDCDRNTEEGLKYCKDNNK